MLRQTSAMTSSPPRRPREHKRTAVDLDVIVNGVLNHIGGRITDLSEGGARIDGASLPERSRCEIHYGGQIVYAVVMWSEYDRMGVRFPYELTHGPLFRALEAAREATPSGPARIFLSQRHTGFGRRGLN
ncbi:PilZ domain-containing protein [Sphingopyxis indica]|uniref:PilZ domain-containing protein n=2 Tax=Sphingopyxis indica TaxID=436663 RepID=A0A239DSY7_9SPHN|nr:PilZ domain-containing protein [Sphingopyxis indica]